MPHTARIVERLLSRRLAREHARAMVGDLIEDHDEQRRKHGRVRAVIWIAFETVSILNAYRRYSRLTAGASPSPRRNPMRPEDVRHAVRRLMHRPAASLVSTLALASGIAATAVAWSLLSSVLLRPLNVADPDRLMVLNASYTTRGGGPGRTSYTFLYPAVDAVRQSGAFGEVAAGGPWSVTIDELGVRQMREAYFATHDLFETLGVRLERGRLFDADDDRRGAAPVAIVSHRYWNRVLGAGADLGRTLEVNGVAASVIGVVSPDFRGLSLAAEPDLYLPLHVVGDVANKTTNFFADESRRESPTSWITIVGRLASGKSIQEVSARLNALPNDMRRGATLGLTDVNTAAVPEAARAGMRGFGRLLATTVALLLLISALTVGLLLLIRTEARRDEFAMCLALGASRLRLASGIALEGAVLAAAGATLAVPLAWWLFGALRSYRLPGRVSIDRLSLGIDPGIILAAAAAAVAVTMLMALVAATTAFSANVADALRTRAGGTPRITRRRMRSGLVTAQVAMTLVLLAGAALFGKSLLAALRLNPGFDTARLVTADIPLSAAGYTRVRRQDFFAELVTRLDRTPSIDSAAMMQWQGGMTPNGVLTIDGLPRKFPSLVSYVAVDDRYFRTMGMPILRGRDFDPTDSITTPLVVIVSESFGRVLAEGADPLGHKIRETHSKIGEEPATTTIVGIVPDIVTNVSVLEPLVIYYSLAQQTLERPSIVVKAAGDAARAKADVLAAVKDLDATLAPAPFMTMQEQIVRQMGPQGFGALVLGVLGAIAVFLTLLGAYVLAESMAAVRRREVGIRAALGATRASLSRLLIGETLRLVGIGIAAGLAIAWLGAGTIRAFLYQVEPLDWTALIMASAAVLVLTLAVSVRPVLRSSRADLAQVLRDE
jgi:predicted permease